MKTLITLLFGCCFGSAVAQSNLPACLGTDVTRWTACFGTASTAGHTYIGEFKDGNFNGQGAYTYANGDKYVGEFKDGKYNGQGTETFANGDKYVGEYKDGQRNVSVFKWFETDGLISQRRDWLIGFKV